MQKRLTAWAISLVLLFGLPLGDTANAAQYFAAGGTPVAIDDGGIGFTTDEESAFDLADVLANDSDPDGNWFWVAAYETSGTNGLVAPRVIQGGALDTTFGNEGKLTTDFGKQERGRAVALQADGKIVVAGHEIYSSNDNFALARYNPDGSLDSSFGSNGKLTTDFGAMENVCDVVVQADGKIVVAGNVNYGSSYDFALARYNPDGSLDSTFNGDGKQQTDFSGRKDVAQGMALQPDGKIVVVGYSHNGTDEDFALARYNTNGTLDSTFSGDGKQTSDSGRPEEGFAVALQPDGKIVVVGRKSKYTGNNDFILARYNPDGILDARFGNGGWQNTDFGGYEYAYALTMQPDGKMVAAGFSNSTKNLVLARYNPDGRLDSTFSGDGMQTTDVDGDDVGRAVVVQADGKILVAGDAINYNSGYGSFNFILARYNADGLLDTTFDGDGKVITNFGGVDTANDAAIQSDGRIVLAGYSNSDFALARYTPGALAFRYDPDGHFEYLDDGEVATDTFTYTISNGALSDTATVTITINGLNDAPLTNGQSLSTAEDTPLPIALNALDVDGEDLTWIIGNAAHGALSGEAPNLVYTPALNYNGPDSFTFKVSDGTVESNLATVTIAVTAVNDAPDAVDDTYQMDEDTPLVVLEPGVLENDQDVEGDGFLVTLLTFPAHGKISLAGYGSFIYTPDKDFNGPDGFIYRLISYPEKAWIDDAAVTINVRPVNDAPVAFPIPDVEWLARAAHTYLIPAFDDADGDTLSYTATADGTPLPAWLSIDPATGSFSGTPSNVDVGAYHIEVSASDGLGGTDAASFTLTVEINPFTIFMPVIHR